jgi:hypothetical protein
MKVRHSFRPPPVVQRRLKLAAAALVSALLWSQVLPAWDAQLGVPPQEARHEH